MMSTKRPLSFTAAAALAASTLMFIGTPTANAANARLWENCTAVNKKYPHGVGRLHARDHVTSGTPVTTFKRSNRLYRKAMLHNRGLDRDLDKIACEKH